MQWIWLKIKRNVLSFNCITTWHCGLLLKLGLWNFLPKSVSVWNEMFTSNNEEHSPRKTLNAYQSICSTYKMEKLTGFRFEIQIIDSKKYLQIHRVRAIWKNHYHIFSIFIYICFHKRAFYPCAAVVRHMVGDGGPWNSCVSRVDRFRLFAETPTLPHVCKLLILIKQPMAVCLYQGVVVSTALNLKFGLFGWKLDNKAQS